VSVKTHIRVKVAVNPTKYNGIILAFYVFTYTSMCNTSSPPIRCQTLVIFTLVYPSPNFTCPVNVQNVESKIPIDVDFVAR
jgi:hypothetical protein